MPTQNKLAALSDAVEQVSNLIAENEALIDEVKELRKRLQDAEKTSSENAAAYNRLSAQMTELLLTPGVAQALKAHLPATQKGNYHV